MAIVWIAAMVVFAVIEFATYQLVSVWFVGGALAGLIAEQCGASEVVQILVFALVTGLLLICTRPLVKKLKAPKAQTNVGELIGREAVVTKGIDNVLGEGEAKVNGNFWTARSADGSRIPEGKVVKIKEIEGVKLIVE